MSRRLVAIVTTLALAAGALFAISASAVLRADEQTQQTGRGGGAGVMGGSPSATTPPRPSAAPVDPTGALSGVVVNRVTDKPIAGAQVQISAARYGSSRQLTDEKGRFIFTRLPPGDNYLVRVTRAGYEDVPISTRFVLTDGQWVSDARLFLTRLGSIGGRITDENGDPVVGIFVRVLEQVMVSGLPQLAAGPAAKTDDRGVYRITGLTSGTYLVHVPSVQWSAPIGTSDATLSGLTADERREMEAVGRALPPRRDQTVNLDGKNLLFLGGGALPPSMSSTGDRVMAYPMTFYPAARTVSEASAIGLGRGEDRSDIDVQVRPVATVRVSGVIEPPAGMNTAGMTARLVPDGLAGVGNGAEAATALVGPDGTFTCLNVPPGVYTLTAGEPVMEFRTGSAVPDPGGALPLPPGWRMSSMGIGAVLSGPPGMRYAYGSSADTNGYAARSTIAVGTSDLTGVVVPLKHAAAISGRVVYETAPTAAPGAPLAPPQAQLVGAVHAEPATGDASLGILTGRAEQDGAGTAFLIPGARPGQYVLRFFSRASTIKSIVDGDKDYTFKPLDVSGHDLTDLVVTITNDVAKIVGVVKDRRGQPLRDGSVILFPVERDQSSGYGLTPTRLLSTSISNDGSYRFPTVRAGSYFVVAVDASLATAWQDPRFLEAAAGVASRVSVDWGDSKTVTLSAQQVPGYRVPGSRP